MAGRKKDVNDRVKKQPSNNQWFQNAAKSLGFTSAEIIKDLLPNTAEFVDWNKSDTMDLLKSMRTNSSSRSMVNKQFKNIPQIKAASDILKNVKEDIMSGNFNNKEREFEFDDMDFGFGDMLDDDSKDMIINEDKNNPTIIDTMPLAKIINSSNEATLETMINVAEQQMAVESEKIMFNHKSTTAILGGLNAINDNLATLVRFNAESTAKYHAASLKFYEDSLKFLKESNKNVKSSDEIDDLKFGSDLYTSRGGVKLKEFKNIIKKNMDDMHEKNPVGSSMMSMLADPMFYKQLAKNPIGMLSRVMATELMPAATKTAMKAIDESITSILPSIMAKINTFDGDENPLYNYLFKVFGSKAKLDYEVDLGKYEKGAISWDGESKKALVEVIPAYLRRIESALTGQEERFYNYDSGKFTDMKNLKKDYKKKLRERETYGYGDLRNKALDIAQGMGANQDVMEQFEADMDELLAAMTKKGSRINPLLYKNKNGETVDELFDEMLFDFDPQRRDFVRKVFSGLSKNDLLKMAASGIDESRRETQRYYDEIRKNTNLSGHNLLYSEDDIKAVYKPNGGIMGQTDKFGLSQLDYLRDIRSALINGIRVFPEDPNVKRYKHWKPNLGLINKEWDEEKEYRQKQSKEKIVYGSEEKSRDFNYDELLKMSDEEVRKIYEEKNKISNKQYKGPLGKALNKVNGTVKGVASKIENKAFDMLFGDEKELPPDLQERLVGVAPNDTKGLFASLKGFFQDSLKSTVAYFTGQGFTMSDGTKVEANPNSFLNKMKSFFSGSVDKLTSGEEGGLLGKLSKDFMDGFNQFKVSLFGEKNLDGKQTRETIKDLTNKVKSRLPKAIGMGLGSAMVKTFAASQLGVLGSVLLPGGPIGAALVGTTFGFLRQSETFNKWMFGDVDEDGNRMGGIISKEFQDKIKENKGLLGKAAGVGVLSSLVLGPVAGSLLGIGTTMVAKNEAFQEFLYGKDYKEKDKKSLMDGAFGKVYKSMLGKESNPKLATFLGAGGLGVGLAQGVGLLPSFLLPGGPIMGSMLGLAAGITASSDKFQEFLFGEKDVDGKRYGGLMTKFTNWMDTSLLQPLKIKAQEINDKLYGFLKGNLFDPIANAFEPIKQAGKFMIDDIKESIKESFMSVTEPVVSSFREHVTKPLGAALKKALINPLKSLVKGTFSMIGKIAGGIITSPIAMISKMAEGYNEKHVLEKEKKRRKDEYINDIEQNGMTVGKFFKAFTVGRMSKEEQEEVLNRELSYRQGKTRKERRQAQKDELAKEMGKRAEKRADLQKQFEEDKAFGKASGWKYASKSQKEKRERELKEKEAWMQERMLTQSEETGEKVSKMSGVVNKVSEYTEGTVDVLKDIHGLLKDNLKALGKKTGMSDVINDLRDKGQSHEDGLDEVPKDGYVAELHKGEMVVPKKPAGVLRNIFGGGASIISKMMNDEAKDRNDNALGLTDEEAEQRKELQDIDRKEKVSRKSVDFLQNKVAAKKKEKEEKKWRDDILSAIHGVGGKISASAAATSSWFDKIKSFIGDLPDGISKGIGSLLKSLGIGGTLAAIATYLGGEWHEYKDSEEYIESRTDKDDKMVFDNADYEIGKKFLNSGTRKAFMKPIKVAKEKIVDPIVDIGKKAYKSKPGQAIVKGTKKLGSSITDGVKKGVTKIDDYINPKKTITGKTFLGTTYKHTTDVIDKSARKGIAKPVGAVVDAAKSAKNGAKNTITKFIDIAKKALDLFKGKLAEKFPKIGKFVSKCDGIFAKILKSADDVIKKFSKKIAAFTSSSALKSNPVGLALDVVLAAGDFISGLTAGNAGNLFGVAKQNVDAKMRGITAVLQTVCNFSWFGVIWIINEITNSMFGINFIRSLAVWIYNAIPGDKIDTNDSDISNCDSIESALNVLGVPENQIGLFKDGDKWKDFSKAKNEEFGGLISDREQMELARLQYNLENGTNLDSDAWVDKQSQTLGGKVLDAITKPFKKTNAEKEKKAKKKLDKYTKNVDKYEKKVEDSKNPISKGWNKMLLSYNKKKQEKYDKKYTALKNVNDKKNGKTTENEKAKAEDYINYNAANNTQKEAAMNNYEMQFRAELKNQGVTLDDNGQVLTDDAGQGDGEKDKDPYGIKAAKKQEKEGKTKETSGLSKLISKASQSFIKNIKNLGNTVGKGLKNNILLTTKAFNASQKGLSKIAKNTTKKLTKDTEKSNKDLTTSTKDLLTTVKESIKKAKEKVQGVSKSLSNIQVGSISLGDIKDSLTNSVKSVVEKVFGFLGLGDTDSNSSSTKKSSTSSSDDGNWFTNALNKGKETVKSWFNLGSAGTETRTRTNRESGYIQPSNTTNNTSNTNNKFVFYSQSDTRWGNNRIGGTKKNMTEAGCGPTSLAMAISQMTGEEITPDVIARLGKDYLPGYSEYKLFPEMAKKFGMNYYDTADATEIMDSIRSGKPVILSGRSDGTGMTPYTKEGHIVVANHVDGNRVFINDPRGKEFSGYYDISTLMSGLNRGMVLSPSAQMNVNKYSRGKVEGWRNPLGENPNSIPLLYGDSEFTNMKENLGGTAGKVRVADRVLSYARAFLANTSKFKYSQAQGKTTGRHGIDNNNIGADCSSFVSHVMSVAGDRGRMDYLSGGWWTDAPGTVVNDPQIADVVCQDGHVGIYSGDGKYIHMSGTRDGIKESKAIQKGNNKHRGYRRVLQDPNAMVDANITGGNSLLGSVVATESGNPVMSGGGTATTTNSDSSSVDQMGIFAKMGNIANNLMASIFNGKQVDLYATTSDTDSSTTGGTVDISGSPNTRRAVWDFFTGMGYSKEATAGIMGNLQQESGMNPTSKQGGGGPGRGIAQWTVNEGRFKGLEAHAKSKGKDWTDLQSQLEWIDLELNGKDPTTASKLNKNFGGIQGLKSATSTKWAVEAFEKSFERAGKPNYTNRYKYADSVYNEFANAGAGAGGYATATSAETAPSDGSIPTSMNGWAYYKQGDPKWQEDISGKKIGPSGCGMASHAMMLTTMFGKEITPVTVGKWARSNGHWNNGMGWDMPSSVAKLFGLTNPLEIKKDGGASNSDLDRVKAEIKAGRPVVLSGKGKSNDTNSPFTNGGHIVLAVGVDGQNRLIINDPRGTQYTKAYEDKGVMDIGTGLRGAWSFDKTSSAAIPNDWSTGSDFTATGRQSTTGDGTTAETPDQMGVFAKLGTIGNNLMSSIFNGKSMFSSSDTTITTSSDSTATGTGKFPKYNLNNSQLKGIANILQHEQPGYEGMQAEASLMANLTDISGDDKATVDNLVAKATGGWFAKGKSRFNNPGSPNETAMDAARKVLMEGKRTVPRYVNEHDCFSDLTNVTTGGKAINKTDRSAYKPHDTKISNKYGASGIFHSFPNSKSDPFYYTSEANRQKWGDDCYTPTPPSGDAGQGDGKTYWANGTNTTKVKYTGNNAGKGTETAAYTNAKRAIDKLDRQITNAMNNQSAPGNMTSGEYVEVLAAIVEQLQAINNNTANTAKGVNDIQIVSANETVSSTKTNTQTKKPIDTRQANGNTGYDIARKIAAYK